MKMLRDKNIIWLLLSYVVFQLGTLFLGVGLFFFVYIIIYLIAIIYSATTISKAIKQTGNLNFLIRSLLLFFIANLILFLIYIPTLIYNPEINWKLKGEIAQDPMILQVYVPPIFFVIALVIITATAMINKDRYKSATVREL
ncbi:MAG: hypothetical protein JWN83_206 [Chitinophagaceae bacterium]|nr:hypothetical protein [Chitinophagaceae bacterium]